MAKKTKGDKGLTKKQAKQARKVEQAVAKLKAKAAADRARADKRARKAAEERKAAAETPDVIAELNATLAAQTPESVAAELAAEPEPVAPPPNAATPAELAELLRVGTGFELSALDPSSTPGFDGARSAADESSAATEAELAEWQERLYAEAKGGGTRSVLLIIQGMDTSGKGGIVRHVVGALDPQGVRLTSFKAPTEQERAKGYLWRIRQALPAPGQVGVFDRSQYEDVLIARVRSLVPRSTWARRYSGINTFERQTVAKGTTIIKVMLHISSDEQKARLAERLARPDKHWKYNPRDLDERALWDAYQQAYADAVTTCSTPEAPWFVVPADHKWYARWAVQNLLLNAFRGLDPAWPPADFDPAVEAERLAAT